MQKRCSRCLRRLDLEAFAANRGRNDGLQNNCRECQREYVKQHYAANTTYYLAKAKRANDKRRGLRRQTLAELKAVPCADCGCAYPPWVMDFDHVRGAKLFNLSAITQLGPKGILAEVAKCEIVCANCHRDRTYRRLNDAPIAQSG